MAIAVLGRIRWHLHEVVEALGLIGAVGLACAAAALSLWLFAVEPTRREIAELKSLADEMAAKDGSRKTHAKLAAITPAQRLATFFEQFPREDGVLDAVEKLFNSASEFGIKVDEGRYQLKGGASDVLTRYEIDVPVRGTYSRVRAFVNKLLADVPYVALASLTFEREKASAAELNAIVQLTLFFRPDVVLVRQ